MSRKYLKSAAALSALFFLYHPISMRAEEPATAFPVPPILFADEPFKSCEGISFNGEGHLFATCNNALWKVEVDGSAKHLVDLQSNLGVSGVGDRDLLVADFGATNAFREDRNTDGVVWRVTPEGEKTAHAMGIGDPNVVLVRADGSYLVSDDATSDIYAVTPEGKVSLFTTAVNHPNGIALSSDETTLFVAQMFTSIRPVVGVGRIWSIPLENGVPTDDAELLTDVGRGAFVDGLAIDTEDRIYITANSFGQIWRYDPGNDEKVLIAEGVFGAASAVFGEGKFDRHSIYVTTTFSDGRGGKIWRISVGADGGAVVR